MSTKQSKISIIIPLFNSDKYIIDTLESVKNQTYQNWECILVDDGSTDSSFELVYEYTKSDTRFKLFERSREPKGANTCRNQGVEKATGEYLIFLDADDILELSCLNNRMKAVKDNPQSYFLVFPTSQLLPDGTIISRSTKFSNDPLQDFLDLKFIWTIMGPIWQTAFLKRIGGFDESFPRLQDPELHVRAILEAKGNYKFFSSGLHDNYYRTTGRQRKLTPEACQHRIYGFKLFISKFYKQFGYKVMRKGVLRSTLEVLEYSQMYPIELRQIRQDFFLRSREMGWYSQVDKLLLFVIRLYYDYCPKIRGMGRITRALLRI